jgi:hypothetical protein
MVVDCKHWTGKVDVGEVDAFVGFLLDVGAPLGLLVTTSEWTPAARSRAREQGAHDIDLDVVPFDELAVWRPRNPTVGITGGARLATCSYWDEDGQLRTETVSPDCARRLIEERTGRKTDSR